MSRNGYETQRNIKLNSNRMFNSNSTNKTSVSYEDLKPPVALDSSDDDDSSTSESSSMSSSSGEVILDDYSTFRQPQLRSVSNNNNGFYSIPKVQTLPIIFELSDESRSVSSVSTLPNDDYETDETLSNCSPSLYSKHFKANQNKPITSKDGNNNNAVYNSNKTPMKNEMVKSIDLTEISLPQRKNDASPSSRTSYLSSPSSKAIVNNTHQQITMHYNSSDNDDSVGGTRANISGTTSSTTKQQPVRDNNSHTNDTLSQWTKIDNNNRSLLTSQSDLLYSNKRTPRFQTRTSTPKNSEFIDFDPSNFDSNDTEQLIMSNSVQQQKKPAFQKKQAYQSTLLIKNDIVTDLDDLSPKVPKSSTKDLESDRNNSLVKNEQNAPTAGINNDNNNNGSYLKNQMFKNYSKDDIKNIQKPEKPLPNSKPNVSKDKPNVANTANKSPETMPNYNYQPLTSKESPSKSNLIPKGLVNNYDRNSPTKRSQEITGNVVKMDKTINRVTNDIVRLDNVIDKLSVFNKNFMSNLELMSDAELSSDIDVQSVGAQTEPLHSHQQPPLLPPPQAPTSLYKPVSKNDKLLHRYSSDDSFSSSSDSSTEKESDTESEDSVALKPSPVHQVVPKDLPSPANSNSSSSSTNPITTTTVRDNYNSSVPPTKSPRTVASLKPNNKSSAYYDSDLSSLPESSVCDEPESRDVANQVKYFQRQIRKSAGLFKKSQLEDPPKRLNVPESSGTHHQKQPKTTTSTPTPKPRNSIDENVIRHLSTSSSESSNFDFNARTLSNSNNMGNLSQSPANSDAGSILSLGSNHFERRYMKSGASARFGSKNKIDQMNKSKVEDEFTSLSAKMGNSKMFVKNGMPHSRSYNSLNVLNSPPGEGSNTRHSAVHRSPTYEERVEELSKLIKVHLDRANYDQIRQIFEALLKDNDHDIIDEIIDCFEGQEKLDVADLASEASSAIRDAESIFDMAMSRTDLHNNLRPGLSMSSLCDPHYQNLIHGDKMIYWRADIEEMLPPPMKPPPKPMPTNLLKSAIITPESIAHVDNKVQEVLQIEPTTFTELVSYLIRDCSTDVEKARAVFRWITMYDMKNLAFDPVAPAESLVGVLRSIKNGQVTYNELFYRLCRYAGIHCQFISGYSKGAGYRPGMSIKDNRMFRNVWTAVFVAGAWRFVNCNWGARYLTSRHHEPINTGTLNSVYTQNNEMKFRCDEFYFLTDAKQHIFEHFPDKKQWQLLNRPITLEQFMALPIVKSPFFNANLSFKRNYAETLLTKNGKITVKINMPKAVGVSCRLENRADGSILRGLTLVRILDNHLIVVTAAPSQPGKFYLSIYVNDDWKTEEGREMACSFQVHCSEHNYDRLVTGRFPEVGVLGSTPASLNFGVVVNPGIDPFVIWEERSTLKLNLAITPGVRVGHRMMSYDRSGQNSAPCDSYALLQFQGDGRSQYHLRFPIDAFYCLTIFASTNEPNIPDTEPMECIYRLLVDCRRAQERIPPYPRQTSRWVGFRLLEPTCQQLELNTSYRFKVLGPNCSAMAVVINDTKWNDFTGSTDGIWKGKINTGDELENLSLYGRFGNEDEDEFIKLLDYVLIPKNAK